MFDFVFLFLEMAESQAVAKQAEDQLTSALCQQFGKVCLQQVSPEKCRAAGKGLEVAKLGERATALLHVVDTHGKAYMYTDPVESLICELVLESTGEKIYCSVMKRGASGFYEIGYQATRRGRHQLHIKVEEKHIKGSPFPVVVKLPLEKLGTPIKTITEIKQPRGLAISSRGNIIVAEYRGQCVSIFNPRGRKIKSFGSQGSGPGQFRGPEGVAVDDEDNILVADSGNRRIQKFTSDVEFLMASDNLGLNNPVGVAIHPRSKKLFVADKDDHCIKILNPDLTLSSSFGSKGCGDGEFDRPYDVAFDSTGKVYVADFWNNRIQVFTAEGRYLTQFKSKGSGKGELFGPISINIDSEDVLYVTEYGYDRISVFKCDGQFLRQFGSSGSALGQFDGPFGVVLDKDGNIYVSDSCNNRASDILDISKLGHSNMIHCFSLLSGQSTSYAVH